MLFESQLVKSRLPHLPLEFLIPHKGKASGAQQGVKVKAMQSKISLKFPLAAANLDKKRLGP